MKHIKYVGVENIKDLTFDTPVQVAFHSENDDSDVVNGGIAHGDYIICGCCGGVVPMDEVDYLVVYDNWVDFSSEIMEDYDCDMDAAEAEDEDDFRMAEWNILYDMMLEDEDEENEIMED